MEVHFVPTLTRLQ